MTFQPVSWNQLAREQHPRRKHVLTGARKANLTKLLVLQQSYRRAGRAVQVVTQHRGRFVGRLPPAPPTHVRFRLTKASTIAFAPEETAKNAVEE